MKLEIGKSVVVKQEVLDPDSEKFSLEGWQGRITKIDHETNPENSLITIEWDSVTLERMPAEYIEESEIEGLDWREIVLSESDIDYTEERDSKNHVQHRQKKLSKQFNWVSFGEQGKRILRILDGINMNNEMKCLERWCDYIEKSAQFPIKAKVEESEDNWIIQDDDNITIRNLNHIVDIYGIIAGINNGRKRFDVPLCNLKVLNENKVSYQLIEDYKTWFANR